MPLRVIGYDGAVYRDEINDKAEAEAEIKEHKKKGEPFDENDKRLQTYPAITVVLYFNPKKKWDAPKTLKECFKNVPKEIEPYVNDYKVNLFEIAWLSEETIKKFTSDFRFVADFFRQKRINKRYKAPAGEAKHIREVMELLSAVTQDKRFIDAYNERKAEGRPNNMEVWIDEAEDRGYARGIHQGENLMGKLISALLSDGKQSELKEIATDKARRDELYRYYNIA